MDPCATLGALGCDVRLSFHYFTFGSVSLQFLFLCAAFLCKSGADNKNLYSTYENFTKIFHEIHGCPELPILPIPKCGRVAEQV